MKSVCSKILFFLLLPLPLWAQKNMNEARPEVRLLLAEKTAKYWLEAEIDTAWNRAQMQVALFSGILIQRFATIRTMTADTAGAAGPNAPGGGNWEWYKFGVSPVRLRAVYADSGDRDPLQFTIAETPGEIPHLSGQRKPSFACLQDTILYIYPRPSDTERVHILYYGRPKHLASASENTELPFIVQPAAVWLAASFLLNADYKYDASKTYYDRALAWIAAYRQMNQPVIIPDASR